MEAWFRDVGLSRAVSLNEAKADKIKQAAINAIIPTRLLPQLILQLGVKLLTQRQETLSMQAPMIL